MAHEQAVTLLNFAREQQHRRLKAIKNYLLLDLLDELKAAVRTEILPRWTVVSDQEEVYEMYEGGQ